ncbi:ATP-binding cassette domain-containing protein [Acetatifactor aquisgranensis]|uniref:ATP-binding cassette domain-containing protein n=1 Tax=Acetatifactor aquisgranensis TaxID=2941233 RepID=UPI00203BD61C|nr:ATP-binding cassette domain-containing protein [Acetatifactor aquisgranensis]
MYNIGICDDGENICTSIETMLLQYAREKKIQVDTNVWYTGESLRDYLVSGGYLDILFLDIELFKMTFLPGYSGLKNLDYLASVRGKVQEDEIRKYMELVGLNPDDKKHVGNYSLGMRQRLGIAQALMENPDILILDEPMNALDHNGVEEMRAVLLQMKEQGKLVLIASHFRDDIDILCDEVYGMDAGIMEKIR